MSMADPVSVRDLAARYRGRTVIRGVSFVLRAGERLALTGANGSGKTTTLRMLAGLVAPVAGSGHVLGADVRRFRAIPRGRIGYMPQTIGLYPELDVWTNLLFRARVLGLADPAGVVARALDSHGLGDHARTRVGHLSGGWARRAQWVASVLHRPPLLLLDEPTAGLDSATHGEFRSWLDRFAADGHAIVLITHNAVDLATCDRVLHFRDGRADPV